MRTARMMLDLDQLHQRLIGLSQCLDWVLMNQPITGHYPTLAERKMQLSLPARWLAERAQMELAAMQDLLDDIRVQAIPATISLDTIIMIIIRSKSHAHEKPAPSWIINPP